MSTESNIAAYIVGQDTPSDTVRVTLTIDAYLLSRVDKIAEYAELSRSRIFTLLIEYAIGTFEASRLYDPNLDTSIEGDSNV